MDNEFDFYGLVWAVEYCSKMLDGISDAPDTKDFGLDSDADYNKYFNKLYELYDIAVANNAVDQLIEELKEDKVDTYYIDDIKEEADYFKAEAEHEDLMYSVEEGDKVRLSNGNVFYVVSIDGNSLWVSTKKGGPEGWYADLHEVEEILEKNEEY